MRARLVYAMMVMAMAGTNLVADVVRTSPDVPYTAVFEQGNWLPGLQTYILDNTTYSWVYWRASSASGGIACRPSGGWLAPRQSVSILLHPAASMYYVAPGVYNDQVRLDFDVRLLGDVNGDGIVDVLDVVEIVDIFGSDDIRGDFDGSGVVDITDVLQLVQHYGQHSDTTQI